MSMQPQFAGLLIGGFLPAIIYGFTGLFAKASTHTGIGTGPYLIIIGVAIAVVGVVFSLVVPDRTLSTRSGIEALLMGLTWGIGTGLIAIGLSHYRLPISKLVPLYNMNTLVTILLSLIIFAEWQQVNVLKLIVGAVLIMIGGVLVTLA